MTEPIHYDRPEDDAMPGWCPVCDLPEIECICLEEEQFALDYDDDDGYCDLCGGEGVIITCCDDMCNGIGHCIHSDGEEICPRCHGGL